MITPLSPDTTPTPTGDTEDLTGKTGSFRLRIRPAEWGLFLAFLLVTAARHTALLFNWQGGHHKVARQNDEPNAEACFARGGRVSYAMIDLGDLELIPQVGPQLASNLLREREAVLRACESTGTKSDIAACLEMVPGVGPTTAGNLANYLFVGSEPHKAPGFCQEAE